MVHAPIHDALRPPDAAKALLFDCDGTLANTAAVHYAALAQAFERFSLPFPRRWYWERLGISLNELVVDYGRDFGTRPPEAEISRGHRDGFRVHVDRCVEIAEVVAVARAYRGRMPLAVVSGGDPANVRLTLKTLGIAPLFDVVLCVGEGVAVGKPAPDIYLEAARRLGLAPADCHVYEDSPEGLAAARAAGMPHVDVSPFRDLGAVVLAGEP